MANIKHTFVPQNFLYPEIEHSDRVFGANYLTGTVLRDDGDWRTFTPPEELQARNGVEPASCYVQANQHVIATLQEEQFNLPDQNYSERFNFILSSGTQNGGDPLKAGDSIRKDGMIPDLMLPFSSDITSWEKFASFESGSEQKCLEEGQAWLKTWKPNYFMLFEREDSLESKYTKLRQALLFSPCPISVTAWYLKDGVYVKPEGSRDNHLVEAVYVDVDNCIWVWDTYAPFLKKLAPNFNSDFGMRWGLTKVETVKKKLWWQEFLNWFNSLFYVPKYS